jgi:hypothetical protein
MRGLLPCATPFVLQGVYPENCFLNGVCNERTFPLIPCRKRQSRVCGLSKDHGHTSSDLAVL